MAAITYSSANVTMVVAGKLIVGWADGDFVKISYNNDAVTLAMGSDGIGTRSFSRDYSGTVEITLMASSPSNDYLSALYLADQQSYAGVFPFLLRDASGLTLATAESMWIKKMTDVMFSRTVSNRVYQLETDRITVTSSATGAIAAA